LATIDPAKNEVLLYPRLSAEGVAAEPIRRELGGSPISIVYKKISDTACFLVLSQSDHTIYALDEKTLEIKHQAQLKAQQPQTFAVAANAPYAFYVFANNKGRHIGRFGLTAFKDDGEVETGPTEVDDIAVSADATYVYGRSTFSSPHGAYVYRKAPTIADHPIRYASSVADMFRDSGPFFPGLSEQEVASGTYILSPDLARSVADLEMPAGLMLLDRPVTFTTDGSQIGVVSNNSFKTLATLPLSSADPSQAKAGNRTVRRGTGYVAPQVAGRAGTLLWDARNQNLLVCKEKQVTVVSWADLHVPEEPMLCASVGGSLDASPGQSVKLKIASRDPRAKVELQSGPAGMKLSGDELSWTPTAHDAGQADAVLHISDG